MLTEPLMIIDICKNFLTPECGAKSKQIHEMGTLVLPGKPQTYKPPRFFRGQVYAPHNREKKNAQRILDEQASLQRPGAPPLRQAVKVDVILDFKRPKSHWSKNDPTTGAVSGYSCQILSW